MDSRTTIVIAERAGAHQAELMGSRIIGIDLGTTSSLVAVMEGGKPRLIADAQGRTVMPSLVLVKPNGDVLVGHDAENEAKKYSAKNLLVASLKRSMGKNKEYGLHGSRMPVQLLAAMILAELKLRAEMHVGERINKAVIAVPANFSFSQRQFTKEAALIAGLEPVRIVNEATASICAMQGQMEGKAVIADLGGGTFDVSAIEFGEGVFEVVAAAGAEQLGGDDFTSCVANLIVAGMDSKFDPVYLRSDPITSQRLTDAAEDAKRQLTSAEMVEVKIPFVLTRDGDFITLASTVSRKQFENACQSLFDRMEQIVSGVCAASGFWKATEKSQPTPPPDAIVVPAPKRNWFSRLFYVDMPVPKKTQTPAPVRSSPIVREPVVWLIGNASRVPEIGKRLRNKYRTWHPPGLLDLKEPVALGAAKIAGILEGTVRDTLLIDVTPNTLGIETEGGIASPVIPRNTRIPATHSQTFTTVEDNQPAISMRICEGERPMSIDNKVLGEIRIDNLPKVGKGIPKVEVRFDVDVNGLLRVTATDDVSKKTSELRCSELVLSDAKLNEYSLAVQQWMRERRFVPPDGPVDLTGEPTIPPIHPKDAPSSEDRESVSYEDYVCVMKEHGMSVDYSREEWDKPLSDLEEEGNGKPDCEPGTSVPSDGDTADGESRLTQGRTVFELGNKLYAEQRMQQALDCFDTALNLGFESGDGTLYSSRGACLQALEWHLDAIDDFNMAISFEPHDGNLYFMRAMSKGSTGDSSGKLADLQNAIRLSRIDCPLNAAYCLWARDHGHQSHTAMYEWHEMMATLAGDEFNDEYAERAKLRGRRKKGV